MSGPNLIHRRAAVFRPIGPVARKPIECGTDASSMGEAQTTSDAAFVPRSRTDPAARAPPPAPHRLEGRRLHADMDAPRQRAGIHSAARHAAPGLRVVPELL